MKNEKMHGGFEVGTRVRFSCTQGWEHGDKMLQGVVTNLIQPRKGDRHVWMWVLWDDAKTPVITNWVSIKRVVSRTLAKVA
jgi:hypothetical protein